MIGASDLAFDLPLAIEVCESYCTSGVCVDIIISNETGCRQYVFVIGDPFFVAGALCPLTKREWVRIFEKRSH